jgi:hypothetical protein
VIIPFPKLLYFPAARAKTKIKELALKEVPKGIP